MLNQLSKHQSDQDHNYRAHSELPLLVQQMSDMGLQIMPYMEIAARDILQRYGDDAFILAERLLKLPSAHVRGDPAGRQHHNQRVD